jgi:hypothetical protein
MPNISNPRRIQWENNPDPFVPGGLSVLRGQVFIFFVLLEALGFLNFLPFIFQGDNPVENQVVLR